MDWVKRNPCLDDVFWDDHPRWCFGGGGGPSGTTTTQTVQKSEPWSEQKPYLERGFQEALSEFESARPEYFPGQTYVDQAPETRMALDAASGRAMAGSPIQAEGRQQYLDTVSGNFLNANPYLRGAQEAAMRPVLENFQEQVMPSIRGAFSAAGRYGSPAMGQAIERGARDTVDRLSDISTQMAYANYRDERGVMDRAVQNAPAYAMTDYNDIDALSRVGDEREAFDRTQLQSDIDRFNFEEEKNARKLGQYMQLVQGNYGGTTTSIQQTPYYQQPAWMTGLGLGLQAVGEAGEAAGKAFAKVICHEAWRQGLLPDDIHAADEAYGAIADRRVLAGYHAWAWAVVGAMQRRRWVAVAVAALARPVARELARRMGVGGGSRVGRALLWFGEPVCRLIGKAMETRSGPEQDPV